MITILLPNMEYYKSWDFIARCYIYSTFKKNGKTRQLKKGPSSGNENEWHFKLTNQQIYKICKLPTLTDYIYDQQAKWFAHIVRSENDKFIKTLTFSAHKISSRGRPITTLERSIYNRYSDDKDRILKNCFDRIQRLFRMSVFVVECCLTN